MGCDTKGFIATDKKDIWEVERVIRDFLKTRPREKNHPTWIKNPNAEQNAEFRLTGQSGYFIVDFQDGEDKRHLNVFFCCDCDYEEIYRGPKISFMLGCWGKSDEIIKGILERLKHLGRAFYIYNDCSDEEWQELI